MKSTQLKVLVLGGVVSWATAAHGGCDLLLRDGVFSTFNASSYRLSSDQWHQAWCNGVLEKSSSGSSSGVKLKVVVDEIPLGMSFDQASNFQKSYQSSFCGTKARDQLDLSQDTVFRSMADPSLVDGYVQCRKVESKGLETDFALSPDGRTFQITMRYTTPFAMKDRPNIKSISFRPKSAVVSCDGNLKPPLKLNENSNSLHCERKASEALSVLIDTDVGPFARDLAAVPSPPTDQEKVLAALPHGTILLWASKGKIPSGWAVCDGKNGTPDLTNRYPSGTTDVAVIGETFGKEKHAHGGSGKTGQAEHEGWSPGHQFQREGGSAFNHTHAVSISTDEQSNLPPSTRIIFIMKV